MYVCMLVDLRCEEGSVGWSVGWSVGSSVGLWDEV